LGFLPLEGATPARPISGGRRCRCLCACRVTTRSAIGVTPRRGGALTGEGRGCAGLGKAGVGCCRAVRVRWAGDGEHDRPVFAYVPSRAVFVRWLGEAEAAACAEAPGHGRVQGYALAARAARQARCSDAEVVRRPWVATGVDALCVYGPGGVWLCLCRCVSPWPGQSRPLVVARSAHGAQGRRGYVVTGCRDTVGAARWPNKGERHEGQAGRR